MKTKSLLVFLCCWMASCMAVFGQKSQVEIKGIIKGLNGREVRLVDGRKVVAQATVQGDTYTVSAEVVSDDGRFYQLHVPALGELAPSMQAPSIFFFIDSPKLNIDMEIKDGSLQKTRLVGSPDSEEYDRLYQSNPYTRSLDEALEVYNRAFAVYNEQEKSESNWKQLEQASKQVQQLMDQQYQAFLQMIPTHSGSDALFALITGGNLPEEAAQIRKMLALFDSAFVERNYYARQWMQQLKNIQACEVGQSAPDFELRMSDGKMGKLSDYRGSYVLVDFWASWCGPCKREIPNLKQVYADYKDKGLQLIGVSIDRDEQAWLQSIREKQLDYPQFIDPEGVTSRLYNYQGIPFIILVGPDGTILEKGLRGEDVRKQVSQHLQQPASSFDIQVTLDQPYTGKVYLSHLTDRLVKLDSLELKEASRFAFSGPLQEVDQYRIFSRPYAIDCEVVVEPGGQYSVHVANRKAEVKVTRGKEQVLMNQYQTLVQPFEQQRRELEEQQEAVAAQPELLQRLQAQLTKVWEAEEQVTRSFILQHGKSYTAALLACDLLLYTYPMLEEIHASLDIQRFQDRAPMRKFLKKFRTAKQHWMEGLVAPDFVTKDLKGNTVRLADFKGDYLLLDFWASWCRPCRKKAKELKQLLPELDKRGIRVCGISMDDKREQWEQATREDGIAWTNTSELLPFKNHPIADAYRVQQLPTLFLIGPDGKIVKQNPSIETLLALPVR